jgi:hypothetical protein
MNLNIACQWQEPAPKDDPRVDVAQRDGLPYPTNKRCGKVLQFDHVTVPWSRPGMNETYAVAFIMTDDNEFIVKRLSEIRPC